MNPPRHPAPEADSIVADATWKKHHDRGGLKPTAKFRRRYAAETTPQLRAKFDNAGYGRHGHLITERRLN
ncbi:MAG TPA: hypothetical protein VKG02_12390 [Blastocatellia bacterium]|nr:hypothetical protein [Blastocatellia bacterium]